MIYFDNAAFLKNKPKSSILSAYYATKYLTANPGRSGHFLSLRCEEFVYKTRLKLSKMFNNRHIDRVIFTKNCTEALNTAIFGVLERGDEVISTVTEHNSVLRPLLHLEKTNFITLKIAKPAGTHICATDVLPLLSKRTKLICINSASNVTGQKNDFENIAKNTNAYLLVDGAQCAGHIPINMDEMGIDILCVAGHKGLCSAQTIGALIFRDSVEIAPTFFGGSGTDSFLPVPEFYPEKLEAGTLNLSAICSLLDGADFAEKNMAYSIKKLNSLSEYLICGLKRLGAKIYSTPNPFGIVAFSLGGLSSAFVAEELSTRFQICVRGGFHCAPLMHKFLHTDTDGLVRVSMSHASTKAQVNKFLQAVCALNRL